MGFWLMILAELDLTMGFGSNDTEDDLAHKSDSQIHIMRPDIENEKFPFLFYGLDPSVDPQVP